MTPSAFHVDVELRKVKRLLRGKTDEEILELPRMRNPQKVAAQQMLAHAYLYTCYSSHHLAALVAFRMIELTINYGLSGMSAMAMGVYSIALCRYVSFFGINALRCVNETRLNHSLLQIQSSG